MAAGPDRDQPERQADREVETSERQLAVFTESLALEHPGAEGGVSTEQARARDTVGIGVDGCANEHAQSERTAHVHDQRPQRELGHDPSGDRSVQSKACHGADAAREPDPCNDGERHAGTTVRRTRLVAMTTAPKPSRMLAPAYRRASPIRSASSMRSSSICIVEKVVSAPQMPVPRNGRRYAESGSRSCSRVAK